MKIHHNVEKQLFLSKLVYWSVVFYTMLAGISIGLWLIQQGLVFIKQPMLLSVLALMMFFVAGSALIFSFTNTVCFILLKPKIKHTVYMLIWMLIAVITAVFYILMLIQAVLTQVSM